MDNEVLVLESYLRRLEENKWPVFERPNPVAGYSSNGVNVYGDQKSITAVIDAFHEAGTVKELRKRVKDAETRLKIAESLISQLQQGYVRGKGGCTASSSKSTCDRRGLEPF